VLVLEIQDSLLTFPFLQSPHLFSKPGLLVFDFPHFYLPLEGPRLVDLPLVALGAYFVVVAGGRLGSYSGGEGEVAARALLSVGFHLLSFGFDCL
jgi:hypothetical protein